MKTKLISITKPIDGITAEQLIVYTARVSNPNNQDNHHTARNLLRYCIENKHWSVFEMVDMTIEVQTSLAIATQLLRHKSFSFQMFSQRYSTANTFEPVELRKQAEINRQSSTEIIDIEWINKKVTNAISAAEILYLDLLNIGVARETARFILPQCTSTTLYMKGSIRSWIHYFQVRRDEHTQKEHRQLADEMYQIFKQVFPIICELLEEN